MERESYQKCINDLFDGLQSLLDANIKMGEKIEKLEKIAQDYETLKVNYDKLDGCTHACCWAHVHRISWSVLKDYKYIFAQEFIDLKSILYKVELKSILLHRTEVKVLTARKLKAAPVLNDLDKKAMTLRAPKELNG